MPSSLADEQRAFFLDLYRKHGSSPRSLGWRDSATQAERFRKAACAFGHETGPFSVHEIGCGLGDFGGYLARTFPSAQYSGSEVCEEFTGVCRERFPSSTFHTRDVSSSLPDESYDYVVLIGVFNVRLSRSDQEWFEFVKRMLVNMYAMTRKAIAADFLTSYHAKEHALPDLYYQDPKQLMDFAAAELSRHFELDHSGPLFEYTLRVNRASHVASSYPEREFDRYFRGGPGELPG
jgi:cyclopropane fatty-acyl-phospholipid synthase-like methyltransferase